MGSARDDDDAPDTTFVQTERKAARVEEYWTLISVVVFLLITVDMITTMYAVAIHGPAAEANPLMRWVLEQSLWMLAGVNIIAGTAIALMFHGMMRLFTASSRPGSRYFGLAIELWLGVLILCGLLVFVNNLGVIFLGQSLL